MSSIDAAPNDFNANFVLKLAKDTVLDKSTIQVYHLLTPGMIKDRVGMVRFLFSKNNIFNINDSIQSKLIIFRTCTNSSFLIENIKS